MTGMHTIAFLPHTADIRMKIEADSPEEIFKGAFEGLQKLLKPKLTKKRSDTHDEKITLESYDQTLLLVDFLNRVLSLSHINRIIYDQIEIVQLSDKKISATIKGSPEDNWEEDIKAVTYHEAYVVQKQNGEWECKLIFDI